ncbi:unnamed protein product [Urochloa humidicola]
MNSIFFRDGDRIEWPIVLAFALLRCENRRRRALIAGGAVLSSATPTRSTSSPTCATSSTCPTSPTSSPPSRLPATPRWGPEPHPPSLRQQVLRRQVKEPTLLAKMNLGLWFAWKSYTIDTNSLDDSTFTKDGLVEQLSLIWDKSDYLWYTTQ